MFLENGFHYDLSEILNGIRFDQGYYYYYRILGTISVIRIFHLYSHRSMMLDAVDYLICLSVILNLSQHAYICIYIT